MLMTRPEVARRRLAAARLRVWRQRRPWHLPARWYYITPWRVVRGYLRVGDWLLWRVWDVSRRPLWWLDDRARALDEYTLARAREASGK